MNKKNVLRLKREIASEVVKSLEPDGSLYTELSGRFCEEDDEDYEEANAQLRYMLERIAEPQIRMSAKRREAWLREREERRQDRLMEGKHE